MSSYDPPVRHVVLVHHAHPQAAPTDGDGHRRAGRYRHFLADHEPRRTTADADVVASGRDDDAAAGRSGGDLPVALKDERLGLGGTVAERRDEDRAPAPPARAYRPPPVAPLPAGPTSGSTRPWLPTAPPPAFPRSLPPVRMQPLPRRAAAKSSTAPALAPPAGRAANRWRHATGATRPQQDHKLLCVGKPTVQLEVPAIRNGRGESSRSCGVVDRTWMSICGTRSRCLPRRTVLAIAVCRA